MTDMDLGLHGKVAIVVGGSSNIGRATCIRLAEEGAKVVIAYSSNDVKAGEALEAIKAAGGEAVAYKGDMTVEAHVNGLCKRAIETFGRIDILIYSAMLWPTNMVTEIPLDEWKRTLDVNLTGVFLTNRWVTKYWLENGMPGKILNFSSQAAFKGSTTFHAHYAAAKAGVVAFTVSLAREVGNKGIAVNAIAPGMALVPGPDAIIDEEAAKYYKTRIPIGRIGSPFEVADLAVFMVSERNSYMIGATVDVSGGMLMR
jgi:3-oxoacyl-[acyl-carrier protein] reductase